MSNKQQEINRMIDDVAVVWKRHAIAILKSKSFNGLPEDDDSACKIAVYVAHKRLGFPYRPLHPDNFEKAKSML